MPARYEDLPPHLKAKVDVALGGTPKQRTPRSPHVPGLPLTHLRCGTTLPDPSEGQLTAHTAACGPGRWEWSPSSPT